MAFNSRQCVICNEPTKRTSGKYCGEDEKGRYSGPMYTCDNSHCNISFERRKHIKAATTQIETNKRHKAK